jgi:hypothetical protein
MARNIAPEYYVFDPVAKTITVDRYIKRIHVFLIVNATKNKVLFNFSDSTTAATISYNYPTYSISNPNGSTVTQTVIALNSSVDTTGMSTTDTIQIIVDDENQKITFDDTFIDAAQKLRTSQPQSLMDTDFEYSVQPSKWEALFLHNNYPSFFAKASGGNSTDLVTMVGDGVRPRSTVTVTTALPHGLVAGNIVSVQETLNFLAEGTALITSVPSTTTFTYTARGVVSGDILSGALTSVYGGDIYDGAHIPGGNYPIGGVSTLNRWQATTDGAAPISTVTVTFDQPHGVYPGALIVVSGTNSFDGNWSVTKVDTPSTLSFQLSRQQSAVSVPSTALIFTKGDGYIQHRPYDGGVLLTTATNTMANSVIRQTRRYFRYQSGKGIQFSTGAQLTPVFDANNLYLNGGSVGTAYVTVETLQDHGLQSGAGIDVEGVITRNTYNPYNGAFTVKDVINNNTFTYAVNLTTAVPTVDINPAGVNVYIHVRKWYGAVTRCGLFDDQNGFFFEYDGTTMHAVRRHSEKEGIGRVSMNQFSSFITGTNTQFRKQLVVGQNIVIKGSTYKVVQINSDTSMNISPAYKGPTAGRVKFLITLNDRTAQADWNIDRFDGTGPSGYKLDMGRMQMVYIDYTWYGAGAIRYGMRTVNGKIAWCHRIQGNNVNNSAYQRSGNLPARYEVSNDPNYFTRMLSGAADGTLGSQLGPDGNIVWVESTTDWPPAGYIFVRDDKACEIMRYSSIGAYDPAKKAAPIYIAERRAAITQIYPDVPFTFSGITTRTTFTPDSSYTGVGGNAQVAVQSITQNCAPTISHWGSSVMMDGRFDNDVNFVFTGGMTKYMSVEAGVQRPLMAVRLAPSVDNAIARNYGIRELINRMQLQMRSMGIQANGSFRIDILLNPAKIEYLPRTPGALALTLGSMTGGGAGTNFFTTAAATGTNGVVPGMTVSGTNILAGTTVSAVAGNRITISTALQGGMSGNYTFTPSKGFTGLPDDWTRDLVGSGSLAQVIYFDNTGPGAGTNLAASGLITGGDSVTSFFSENGSPTSYNQTTVDLSGVRDIGNSILSGNGNVSSPSFPNGPDVLVITATNIGTTTSSISARISWTEAQA